MDGTVLVLIIIVVLLLLAVVALGVVLMQRRRSEGLQKHFGPEYERQLAETGNRKVAETGLRERQQRRSKLDIRELRPEERDEFQDSWNSIQRGFVDDPIRALRDADTLVVEIMSVRGYPVDDFDRRAEDISVDHPDVVNHYREARTIRDESADGSVDTEQQRSAVTSYRSLVEALLGGGDKQPDSEERLDATASPPADTDEPTNDVRPTEERTR